MKVVRYITIIDKNKEIKLIFTFVYRSRVESSDVVMVTDYTGKCQILLPDREINLKACALMINSIMKIGDRTDNSRRVNFCSG